MVNLLRIQRLTGFLEHLLLSFPLSLSLFPVSLSTAPSSCSCSSPSHFSFLPSSSSSPLFCHVQHLHSGSLAHFFSRSLWDFHQLSAQWVGLFIISQSRLFLGGEIIAFLAFISSKQTQKQQANQQALARGVFLLPAFRTYLVTMDQKSQVCS